MKPIQLHLIVESTGAGEVLLLCGAFRIFVGRGLLPLGARAYIY